jgi:serine/threonine protein kinase
MAKRNSDPSFSTAPTEAAVLLLPPGYRIGDYEVIDNIGRGGFGTVFKAVHAVIGKVVAIKVLHPNYSAQPHMVSRFVSEARAVNRIEHKHIIDIFGFGNFQSELGQLHYYVMEYLQGESLEDFLQWHGALPIDTALSILRPIARALHAAHENGIAHRDLKADNVFLAEDREGFIEPKLLDFGIAKLLHDDHHASGAGHRTREGVPVGTPGYMSPEQCQGHAVDHRTDIYAFGILAYRMLSSELPFDDQDSYMDVLFSHIHKPPPPLRDVVHDMPGSIDRCILSMLAKSPADRPQTMLAAQQALESAAAEAGLVVPPEGSRITLSLLHHAEAPRSRTPVVGDDLPTMDDDGSHRGVAAKPAPAEPVSRDSWGDEEEPTHVLPRAPSNDPTGAPINDLAGGPVPERARLPRQADAPRARGIAPLGPPARTARRATTTGGMSSEPGTMLLSRQRGPVRAVAVAGVAAVVVLVALIWTWSSKSSSTKGTTEAATGTSGGAATETTARPESPAPATGPDEIEGAARPAPPVPGPTQPSPVGAQPEFVNITVKGPPRHTEVYKHGGLLGVVPGVIQLERRDVEVMLTFRAEGYWPASRAVKPTADATIEVELTPKNQRRVPRPPRDQGGDGQNGDGQNGDGEGGEKERDELESPFG